MAADPELPEKMAEALFDAVRNHGDDLALQLRAFMDFLNHPSAEIREDAMGTLRHLLKDDLGADDVETLKKKAAEELAELEAEKLKDE